MIALQTRHYEAPPLNEREILRYAGCSPSDRAACEGLLPAIREALAEALPTFRYAVCYGIFPASVTEEGCRLGELFLPSRDLAICLRGCRQAVVFAATVGVGCDRLIRKYSRLSPSRAVLMQAIGAERIESLCDALCRELSAEYALAPRFSPGYGDLSLDRQGPLLAALGATARIGVCLNESLLMSPSKSVTAIVGIKDGK